MVKVVGLNQDGENLGERKMGKILHIYEIDQEVTTDEFVDENFQQRFVHIHLDNGKTILLRGMSFAGKKLDTIKDEDEMVKIFEEIEKEIPEEERTDIGKFLTFKDEEKENVSK